MKQKTNLITIFIILFSILCVGSFTNYWGEYQDDNTNRGFVSDVTSDFTTGTSQLYNAIIGSEYQALTGDLTGDGSPEVVVTQANTIYVLDSDLTIIAEQNIQNTIDTQPSLMIDGSTNIVIISGNKTQIYNLTNNVITSLNNCTSGIDPQLKCYEGNCYTLYDYNGSITTMSQSNKTDCLYTNLTSNMNQNSSYVPTIEEYNYNRMYFICDPDADTQYGICSVRTDTRTLNTDWSADGILDDISSNQDSGNGKLISSPITYPLDGGNYEVIVSHINCTVVGGGNTDTDYIIKAYRYDGTSFWTDRTTLLNYRVSCSKRSQWSIPIIANINESELQYYVCGIATGDPGVWINEFRGLICSKLDGTRNEFREFAPPVNTEGRAYDIFSADLDGDNNDWEIVSNRVILNSSTAGIGTTLQSLTSYFTTSARLSFTDLNNDGFSEIIGVSSGSIKAISTQKTNTIPVLNDSYLYNGFGNNYGYGVPVCLGDTVTYSAQETGGSVRGNYNNDIPTETERLRVDCQLNTTITNGSYTLSNPSVSCSYNSAGIFETRIYINDLANPNDETEYNTGSIIVTVVDGIRGITCGETNPTTVGFTGSTGTNAQTQAQNDAITTVLDPLTGDGSGSNIMKMMIGFIMIIFIIGAFAVQTEIHNPVVLMFIGFISLTIFTLMGMIPAYVMILILIIGAILLLINKFLIGSSAGSD